VPELTHILVIW